MELRDNKLYYIGGVVRDEILGISSLDVDYTYEGNAIAFAQDYNVIKENPDFGTVRILIDNKEIDIASTRREYYPKKGHLPHILEIGCSILNSLSNPA